MDEQSLRELLSDLQDGTVSTDDAVRRLKRLPYAELGMAKIDHHRHLRQSMPEAIYGPGKSVEQCVAIVGELLAHGTGPVLLSRASPEQAAATLVAHPGGSQVGHTVIWRSNSGKEGRIAVITAGTADLPVAEEAVATLRAQGYEPQLVVDVGAAGVHRLFASLSVLEDADALIVVAGMEGALATVVGGIASCPVVAVPTSVGYGAAFEGVTALLAMLAGCAAGTTVVGIDNGYGAACAVIRILNSPVKAAQ